MLESFSSNCGACQVIILSLSLKRLALTLTQNYYVTQLTESTRRRSYKVMLNQLSWLLRGMFSSIISIAMQSAPLKTTGRKNNCRKTSIYVEFIKTISWVNQH